jgi:hypothetical protein
MAKGGGAEIGATKRGKGMKITAIVDRHGLPLSVSTHAANHEVRLVQLWFDFSSSVLRGRFAAVCAVRRDHLDAVLAQRKISSEIAPMTAIRWTKRLSRYLRRWETESSTKRDLNSTGPSSASWMTSMP